VDVRKTAFISACRIYHLCPTTRHSAFRRAYRHALRLPSPAFLLKNCALHFKTACITKSGRVCWADGGGGRTMRFPQRHLLLRPRSNAWFFNLLSRLRAAEQVTPALHHLLSPSSRHVPFLRHALRGSAPGACLAKNRRKRSVARRHQTAGNRRRLLGGTSRTMHSMGGGRARRQSVKPGARTPLLPSWRPGVNLSLICPLRRRDGKTPWLSLLYLHGALQTWHKEVYGVACWRSLARLEQAATQTCLAGRARLAARARRCPRSHGMRTAASRAARAPTPHAPRTLLRTTRCWAGTRTPAAQARRWHGCRE